MSKEQEVKDVAESNDIPVDEAINNCVHEMFVVCEIESNDRYNNHVKDIIWKCANCGHILKLDD